MKGVVRGEREGGGGRGVDEEISERSYLHIGRAVGESWKGMYGNEDKDNLIPILCSLGMRL